MNQPAQLALKDDSGRNFFTLFIAPVFIAIFLCVIAFILVHHEHQKNITAQTEKALLQWLLSHNSETISIDNADGWLRQAAGGLVDKGLFAGFAIQQKGKIIARYGYAPEKIPQISQPAKVEISEPHKLYFLEELKPHHHTASYRIDFAKQESAKLLVFMDHSSQIINILNSLLWGLGLAFVLGIFIIWLGLATKKRLIAPINRLQKALQESAQNNYESDLPPNQSHYLSGLFDSCQTLIEANRALNQGSQMHIDESLSELRESLETVEVQNIELDMARKQALLNAERKSELLATTSHEIRTPLNGIVGFTRLLFDTPLSEQQRDYLLTIEQSAHGLLTVVNDIIDYAKLESGPVSLEFKPVVLQDTVYEALQTLAPAANENQLRLIQHIDPRIPELLLGDPLRLKQVINHLCLYLLRQNAKGNLVIGVMLKQVEDSRCSLIFSISCSNIGVSRQKMNILKKILAEPKTDASSATEVLGISVAQTIAERMGDKITVFDDNGLEFRWAVTLGSQQSDTPEFTQFDSGSLRVLIHESDTDATREIIFNLQAFDVSPRVEKHIDKLHTIAHDKHAQLVILDCATLGQSFSKSDAIKVIAQLAHIRNLHIAVIAPSPIRRQLEQQISGEYIHYLTRPVKRSSFRAVLRAAMGSPIELLQPNKIDMSVKVIVADDNPANSKLVATLLAKENHKVVIANDGQEAVSLYQSHQPDIIFMDIQMPKMDGLEATKKIRSLESAGERIPVIALTANANHDQRQKILIAGMDDFLTKPVSAEDLSHTLRRWVTDRQTPIGPIDAITQRQNENDSQAKIESSKIPLEKAAFIDPPTSDSSVSDSKLDTSPAFRPGEVIQVSPRVFSLRENLKMSNGDPKLAHDMLEMLLKEIPEHKHIINDCLVTGEVLKAAESVHRLRGGAAYTGCISLGEAAANAESLIVEASHADTFDVVMRTRVIRGLQDLISEIEDIQAFERQTDIPALYENL